MAKKFLTVAGLVLLYLAAWAVVLFLVITILGDNDATILVAVLVMFVLIIAVFVPYLDWAAKRVFRFAGEGQPISAAQLRQQIQAVNEFDAPVSIEERGDKLVATWKYLDATWWELLAKAGLTRIYELHMKLDEAQHLVTLIDVTKSVSWRASPTQVRVGFFGFRGILFAYEIGKQWGITENLRPGKVYDYKFVPQEIKMPILNSILRRGWDVRFGIW
jgi:hypothetical protein